MDERLVPGLYAEWRRAIAIRGCSNSILRGGARASATDALLEQVRKARVGECARARYEWVIGARSELESSAPLRAAQLRVSAIAIAGFRDFDLRAPCIGVCRAFKDESATFNYILVF